MTGENRLICVVGKGFKEMISTQHSDVRNTDKVRETQDKLILNLVRADDGADFVVGAGFRHPFPGLVETLRLEERKRKEEAESKHKMLLSALQQKIDDLQDQLDELNRKIKETEEARQRTRSSIAKLQNGEMPELTEDGKFVDPKKEADFQAFERKHGKVDRNDPDALLVALMTLEAEQTSLLDDFYADKSALEEKISDLEYLKEHGSDEEYQAELSKAEQGTLYGATDSSIRVNADTELSARKATGEIEKGSNTSATEADRNAQSFFGTSSISVATSLDGENTSVISAFFNEASLPQLPHQPEQTATHQIQPVAVALNANLMGR